MYLDSSILWWVEAYNWSIWEEKWCSHTSYSRRFVMSLFRDYTFQYGLLLLQNFSFSFSILSWGRKENWTKKDMSCYAAFLSYFSSWRSPLLWTILIPNEVRKKNKRRICAMHEMSDPFALDENGCLSFGQSFLLYKFKTIFVLYDAASQFENPCS